MIITEDFIMMSDYASDKRVSIKFLENQEQDIEDLVDEIMFVLDELEMETLHSFTIETVLATLIPNFAFTVTNVDQKNKTFDLEVNSNGIHLEFEGIELLPVAHIDDEE